MHQTVSCSRRVSAESRGVIVSVFPVTQEPEKYGILSSYSLYLISQFRRQSVVGSLGNGVGEAEKGHKLEKYRGDLEN